MTQVGDPDRPAETDWLDTAARMLPILTVIVPLLGAVSRTTAYAVAAPNLPIALGMTAPLPELVSYGLPSAEA